LSSASVRRASTAPDPMLGVQSETALNFSQVTVFR
jgi:hypothetical protein